MSQEKKSNVGPPIWVESIMSPEEWKERHKTFLTSRLPEPILFKPEYHQGGKWRNGMGKNYSAEEIKIINKQMDLLYKYLKSKKDATISNEGEPVKS